VPMTAVVELEGLVIERLHDSRYNQFDQILEELIELDQCAATT
jgi:hypothetical protein